MNIGFIPEIVFVAYGTNDFNAGNSLLEIRQKCEDCIKKLKKLYNESKIFVISPIWRKDCNIPKKCGRFDDCCKLIKTVVKENDLLLIDGDKLLPHQEDMFADNVHPNDFGFLKYTVNLLKIIKEKQQYANDV